jgi:hypothetical protein
MVPGFMLAIYVPPGTCTSADTCTYSITGTGLDTANDPPTEDTLSTWNLTFVFLGPEMYNAGPNTLESFSVTGTPANGWVYDASESGLTSYGSDGAAFVTFDNDSGVDTDQTTVTYEFFGTDSFWATLGDQSFGATSDSSNLSGAFFVFNNAGPQADGPCTACTVTTTASAVPEPSSVALLATVAGISALLFRRRQRKLAN